MEPDEHSVPVDEIGQRARTAAGWQFLSRGLSTGLQMITSIVLARVLMPKDFGIVAMAMIVTGCAGVFSNLGLGQALVQRREITDEHLRSAFWGTLVMGVLLCGVVVVIAPWVGAYFHEPRIVPVLRLTALTFVLSPFAVVPRSLLQRKLDFRTPLSAGLASSLACGAVGITMALLGYGYWSLVGARLVGELVSTVALCILTRYTPPLIPAVRGIRDLYSFGVGVTGSGLFNYLAGNADYFVVGRMLDAAALGLYTRAYTLIIMPIALVNASIAPVLFPAFSRLQDDPERLRKAYGRVLTVIALVGFPALALLGVSAPELIPAVIGDQWRGAIIPTQILVLGGILRTITNPVGALVRGVGGAYVYGEAWRQAVYAGLLAIGAWLGSHWGIVGVAWAVLAVLVVYTFLFAHLAYVCAGFGAMHYLSTLRGPSIGALGAVLSAAAVRQVAIAFGCSPVLTATTTVAVGGGVALVVMLYLPFREMQDARSELRAQFARLSMGKRRPDSDSEASQV